MIKKLGAVFLTVILCFSPAFTAKVQARSIESVGDVTTITNNGPRISIDYNGQPAYVYYGSSGINIVTDVETVNLETNFEVLKLEVVDDINNDGFVDFLTYQNSPEYTEQLLLVSGSDGKVLNSSRITREGYSQDLGSVLNNVYIQQMLNCGDGTAVIVYDYTVYRIDLKTFETLWSFSETDNIWKVIRLSDGTLAYCGQQNVVGNLNYDTGELLNKINPCQEHKAIQRWDNNREFPATMNVWDIMEINGQLMALGEDGTLSVISFMEGVQAQYPLNVMTEESFAQSLANRIRYSEYGSYYMVTGVMDWPYGGYRFEEVQGDLLLIDCYMGDLNSAATYSDSMFPITAVLFDLSTGEVRSRIFPDNNPCLYLKTCIGEYEGEPCICAVTGASAEAIRLSIYSLDGELKYVKELAVALGSDGARIALSYHDGKYLLEVLKSGCLEISADLKSYDFCYQSEKNSLLEIADDGVYVLYTVNGMKYKVTKFDKTLENELWTRSANTKTTRGYESVRTDLDFNGDGVKDVITVVCQYKDEVPFRSDILIYSGKDGSTLKYNPYVTNTWVEKGVRKYEYLIFREADLFRDIDGDGVKELILSGSVISSRTDKMIGSLSGYVDAEGAHYEVGDINGDGITEIVVVSNKESRLYNSVRTYSYGYLSVEYKKSNTYITNNQALSQDLNSTLIGDLNRDNIREIGMIGKNEMGRETFVIVDGKTLKTLLVMFPKGVHDYNESLAIMDVDLNNDGYNEIYASEYWRYGIYDGRTGEKMLSTSRYYWDDEGYYEEDNYYPDYLIPFNPNVGEMNFRMLDDINGDGLKEIAMVKVMEDTNTWRIYTVARICSGLDGEVLKEIYIGDNDEMGEILEVDNSDKYLALASETDLRIMDMNTLAPVAKFDATAKRVSDFNEHELLIVTKDDLLKLINIDDSFRMTVDVPEETDDYVLHLGWQSLEDYSLMTISDNGSMVYSGTASEYDIRLTEGNHQITLSMNDGQGKHCQKEFHVTLNHQPVRGQWLYGAVGGLTILGYLLGRFQKTVIKRRYKKEASR